jgi:GDPmannose 4,6-dehydratase
MKKVLLTGATGFLGAYLLRQLVKKGYEVRALRRANSSLVLVQDIENQVEWVEGDITDQVSMLNLVKKTKPNIVFHMAFQSHVGTSFEQPIYTAQTGLGALYCLEAIRHSGIHSKFINAATSELMGGVSSDPGNEATIWVPRSPYGAAKAYSAYITRIYRDSYKMFACNSIAYNHETAGKRGPNFVTRKITLAVAAIKNKKQDKLFLGNLDAKRDWSDARDVCAGIILMGESAWAEDYVFASGETHTVREFCQLAFEHAGLGDYSNYVAIDPQFYRPCEVNVLVGDPTKAEIKLGWNPRFSFEDLVKSMVDWDLNNYK